MASSCSSSWSRLTRVGRGRPRDSIRIRLILPLQIFLIPQHRVGHDVPGAWDVQGQAVLLQNVLDRQDRLLRGHTQAKPICAAQFMPAATP